MKNGILLATLQALEETLGELRSLGQVSSAQLQEDWRIRRAIERDLQIAVEAVIDVCQRIIALHRQAPAATSAHAVERCVQLRVLSDHPAYRKMVQFRDFVVHRYERIDVAILVDIVNHRLADFDTFRDEVLRFCKHEDPT
ncbi:MAG: DUF86 domain-containing protein [Verrucomicrobia bacterium]|nr:DUF86 domain-containing protein [Verrucomicrobiota bacterium]